MPLETIRPLVDHYLKTYPPHISVIHFSSVVMWQDHFEFSVEEIDHCLCVWAKQPKAMFAYWALVGQLSPTAINKALSRMREVNPNTARFENISDKDLPIYQDQGLKVYHKANEYVYLKDDIAHYQGNKYKSQRHDVNLVEKHPVIVKDVAEVDVSTLLALFDRWAAHKKTLYQEDDIALDMLNASRCAHAMALHNQDPLGLKGIAVDIGQDTVAYSLGYPLNESTFVVLLEVCDPGIKGLSAFCFSRMCQQPVWDKFKFVNAMDDAGLPAMAYTKKLYHPVAINPIYNAF